MMPLPNAPFPLSPVLGFVIGLVPFGISRSVNSIPFSFANFTMPHVLGGVEVGIFRGELVPPNTMGGCGIHSRRTNPPKYILGLGNDLKVLGVDAPSVSAQMVDLQPLWNFPNEMFVSDPVGASLAPFPCGKSSGECPIPGDGLGRPNPPPTRGRRNLANLGHEAFEFSAIHVPSLADKE